MESGGDWCLIESDPGVFTQLIKKFGATGVQVEEIWSMEASMFDNLRPVHGLIFLFKYIQNEPPTGQLVTDPVLLERIYFAKQVFPILPSLSKIRDLIQIVDVVINNACATQAIISLLLNCEHPDLVLGPELTMLKDFCRSFDPRMRGLALSNSHTIRAAHNSMSQQHVFEIEIQQPTTDDDAYHYVTYIPINGRIYELDGLREGPIDHGPIGPENDWLDVIRPIISRRIQLYTDGEIHFNLMAVVSDRKLVYERQINDLMTSTQMLGMETDDIDGEITRLRMLMEYEDIKMSRYEAEERRRRHNYLPFIIHLLQVLGEQKKLSPLMSKFTKDQTARHMAKRLKT